MTNRTPIAASLLAALTALVIAGCGGSSDSTDSAGAAATGAGSGAKLSLVAYSVPKVAFDKVIPIFQKTAAGKGVTFSSSYGASGDQSRKVAAGLPTDIVNFSLEPDVSKLVDKGLVAPGWNTGAHTGYPFGSVVTIVVRKGNPKHIKTWDDLLQPGLEVVTPNPFSSGSAKWNLLAPYAEKSQGGKDPKAGLAYLDKLISNHIKVQPKSGREASETFLQGTGDALLTYEDEALFFERSGEKIEHVTPPDTFKIENPVAVTKNAKSPTQANAFVDFLYSPAGQKGLAQAGFRPSDPTVAKQFASDFPAPAKLWTIADLGGWSKVNDALFDPDKGTVAKIYNAATS
jgi:sulfate transport system substrate-binding protein